MLKYSLTSSWNVFFGHKLWEKKIIKHFSKQKVSVCLDASMGHLNMDIMCSNQLQDIVDIDLLLVNPVK